MKIATIAPKDTIGLVMIVSPEGELVATRRGVTSSSWAEPRVKSLFILGSKIGIETVSILGRDCRALRALTFDKFGEGGNAAEPDIVIRPIPGALAMAERRASGSRVSSLALRPGHE